MKFLYQVWEDWPDQKKAVFHVMRNDKHDSTGWQHIGTLASYEDANRIKRVAEQCGEILAKAMLRLIN